MSFEQDSLETSSLEVFQVREVGVCPTMASPSRCLALFQASHSASVEDGLGGLCLGGWTWWLVSFQIADSRDDLRKFDSSRTNPGTSAPLNLRTPVPQKVNVFLSKRRDKGLVAELTFQLCNLH